MYTKGPIIGEIKEINYNNKEEIISIFAPICKNL